MKKDLTFLLMIIMLLLTVDTTAQWTSNTALNTPVCTATGTQNNQNIISDGTGGAIIVWADRRNGIDDDLFAQHLDAAGVATWTTDGVAICSSIGEQYLPTIISDGSGGAIIAWHDFRTAVNYDIYAQRIDNNGVVQWTTDGILICSAMYFQYNPVLVSDDSGGAIISWYDVRSGSNYDIYAQRIDALGVALWGIDGIAVCSWSDDQTVPSIIADGLGGAVITWQDRRNGTNYDIYAQRINSSGISLWTADGVAVSTAAFSQFAPRIATDSSAGAIIVWRDIRGGTNDVYAQRINEFGIAQWTTDGAPICTAIGEEMDPVIIGDSLGGAIITWCDSRAGSGNQDIYAQRILGNGLLQWTIDGVVISAGPNIQASPNIISDSSNGAIITWYDYRTGDFDIYAQKVNDLGLVQWTTDGVAISTSIANQDYPTIVSDGSGGAIITWWDYRAGNFDIYAQNVDTYGSMGLTTGITENSDSDELSIYPNPSSTVLSIQMDGNISQVNELSIYDSAGKQISSDNVNFSGGTMTIDISGLPSGIYLLMLESDETKYSKRFIVE